MNEQNLMYPSALSELIGKECECWTQELLNISRKKEIHKFEQGPMSYYGKFIGFDPDFIMLQDSSDSSLTLIKRNIITSISEIKDSNSGGHALEIPEPRGGQASKTPEIHFCDDCLKDREIAVQEARK